MILVDTDHLTVLVNSRSSEHDRLVRRMNDSPDTDFAVPVIAAEEQFRGWMSFISKARTSQQQVKAYESLRLLIAFLGEWKIAPLDVPAAEIFQNLRRNYRRLGSQDLKIASIALCNQAILLTANTADFGQIDKLDCQNWLKEEPA